MKPHCPGLVRNGICSMCGPLVQAQAYDRGRGSAAQRGYGARRRTPAAHTAIDTVRDICYSGIAKGKRFP